jgi:oxygen-dependent protoporphyrinogen oxidase
MSELQDTLQERIERAGLQVHRGIRVTGLRRIDPSTGPIGIETQPGGGNCRDVDAVILALPAFRTAELIGSLASDLAGALREIDYASSAIVVTGHRLADVAHPLDAAGVVIPHAERRKLLAVSFLSRKFPTRAPAERVVLRTFVGGALQPQLLERDDAELVRLVRDELDALLGVSGELEFARVVRYERAMPQYTIGHVQRVERIEQLASRIAGLELAGNAYHGVGIPDCIQSGESAAERVWAHVTGIAPQSAE